MRKTTSWMQRLLALALACVMVLGYVPVSASAEGESSPVTLLTANITSQKTGGGEIIPTEPPAEGEEPVPAETTPLKYTYTVTVTGGDGNSVTDAAVTWSDGSTGYSSQETEAELLSATIVYNGLQLTVDTLDTETSWTATGTTWADIMATSTITAPTINCGGHATFATAPTWTITYGESATANVGDTASLSMGTLNATTIVAGHEFTATTEITPVPVNVTGVTPAQGWYAALPETVTITGDNDATLADSVKTINVNGTERDWVEKDGAYTYSFKPEQSANTIGGTSYTWNVDAVTPTISINYAYVNDDNNTIVNYNYSVGPSGGNIVIEGQTVAVTEGSGTKDITLSGTYDSVTATITNKLTKDAKSATSTKGVLGAPKLTCNGYISKDDTITYVTSNTVLNYKLDNAKRNVVWKVNDVVVEGATEDTLAVTITSEHIGKDLKVSASDSHGRARSVTLKKITVDTVAPTINITAPEGEPAEGYAEKTYFDANRDYTIIITDNAGLKYDECTATATINGNPVAVDVSSGSGTVTVTDGQTLTDINVTAKDQNANEAISSYTTNVHVDTTKPVITGSIAIKYAGETDGSIVKALFNQGGTTYLILDTGAHNENDDGKRDVTVTATYTLDEANPDGTTGGWNGTTKTISKTVKMGEVVALDLGITAKDLAGNVPVAEITLACGENNIVLQPVNGVYTQTVYIDRRAPEDKVEAGKELPEVPEVTLGITSDPNRDFISYDYNGVTYFNGSFIYTMNVMDGKNGSGLSDEDVTLTVTNPDNNITPASQRVSLSNGVGSVNMSVVAGKEDPNATITTRIYDKVGNYYFYNKQIGVDSLAPRVSVALTSDDTAKTTVGGVDFYQKPVTLSFTLTDQLPCTATINYSIDDVAQAPLTLTNNGATAEITVAAGQKLTALTVSAEDALKNSTTAFADSYTFTPIEVDGTPAVANVVISSEGTVKANADGVSYYDKPVSITVSVSDKNITDGNGTAKLTYAIDDVDKEIDLLKQTDKTYTISVENNKVLTALKVKVVDDAGNVTETLTGVAYSNAEGEVSYTGNALAVDQTAPVVSVVKVLNDAKYIQTTDKGVAYYKDGTVTYTVTITDAFLNEDASSIKFNGAGTATFTAGTGTLSAQDTMTLEFTVNDDVTLETIAITALDMIGLTAAEVAVTDPLAEDDLSFAQTENTYTYTGPKVVSDTKAPTASVVLTGNIETLVEKNGVYYVKVKAPAKGLDGIFTGAAKEKVELTLTVKDKNLTLDEVAEKTFISSNTSEKWTLDGDTATYTDAVEVGLHNTAYFKIDVAAYDLVGHPMKLETIRLGETEGNEITIDAEGEWKATISLDRRTPSTEDGEVPEISLTDNASKKFKTVGGMDLYAADFNFTLNVKDDKGEEEDEKHAGLKSVAWTLTDAVATVTAGDNKKTYNDYISIHTENIAVAGKGETDSAVLTIVAEDNVDNTIQYGKNFAFDNLAPRVTVTFDGESVRKNEYFNKTRTATVVVEDLHMPALAEIDEYVKIETQGTASGWKQEGIKYINTFTFAEDGKYTFSMSAKDLAGNETKHSGVTYVGELCDVGRCDPFVIDKTNPVLRVTFAQTPSGRDPQGVQYYAQNVTATATITELNFDAADVTARFNNTNVGLGTWSNDLDHRASVTFGQGNRYSFDIAFQDLAGNHAETYRSPVFSVDTTDPTVVISGGNMKGGQLNIVPGDLTLALTVNDAQQNLSDYAVTLTYLDNNFKKSVVSGAEYYTVTTQQERTTVVINFSKIAKEKKYDGLYTVDVSARDYAGNQVNLTPDITFSLNRFGSTFTTDDEYTLGFLSTGSDGNAYHDGIEKKLVIQEINPNKVWNDEKQKDAGSTITVVVNGTSTKLEQGKHYKQSFSEEGTGNNKWYVYTYEIDPKAFESDGELVDGRYAILLYGVDEAGNKNTNEANASGKLQKNADGEYTGKIEFILDRTAPIITTTGIESRKNYNAEVQQLKIFLSDNTPAGITVYLNGEKIELTETAMAELSTWLVYDEDAGCYVLNVPEQNTLFAGQNIRIVVTDAAGNEAEFEIDDFSVSTNFFVRMLNSTWFLAGIIVLLLLIAMYIFFLLKKKKQTAAQV